MIISMIAAMAKNRTIGKDNALPWHLPGDLGWFKKNTLGKPVIMGRKTWESLPIRPLPGRINVVITRDPHYQPLNASGQPATGVELAASVDEAASLTVLQGVEEIMFMGGASIYEQVLPRAKRLYLTLVEANVEGDAWFPAFDTAQWKTTYSESHNSDEKNPYDYKFLIFERV